MQGAGVAEQWRGRSLFDRNGDRIGSIEQVYFGPDPRKPRWARVSTGIFGLGGASAVPLANAQPTGDGVLVPYTKDHVKDAPKTSPDLTDEEDARLARHYGLPSRGTYAAPAPFWGASPSAPQPPPATPSTADEAAAPADPPSPDPAATASSGSAPVADVPGAAEPEPGTAPEPDRLETPTGTEERAVGSPAAAAAAQDWSFEEPQPRSAEPELGDGGVSGPASHQPVADAAPEPPAGASGSGAAAASAPAGPAEISGEEEEEPEPAPEPRPVPAPGPGTDWTLEEPGWPSAEADASAISAPGETAPPPTVAEERPADPGGSPAGTAAVPDEPPASAAEPELEPVSHGPVSPPPGAAAEPVPPPALAQHLQEFARGLAELGRLLTEHAERLADHAARMPRATAAPGGEGAADE